ncbi:hypothetical protein ACH5RR_025372 [Cinchona calisaya]|uniref:Uncharacterized protein n=1 Tax=Cinchona calisaya TaxID=153742 RepID=A0ABD2Z2T4_9GENT
MEFKSWFETKPEYLSSPRTSSSSSSSNITSPEMQSTSTIYEVTSFSSLESHVNPTLKLSQNTHEKIMMNAFVTHSCIATLRTKTPQISFLALQGNTLYAASLNEINVFDLTDDNYSLADNFTCSGLVKSITFVEKKIFTAHQDCKIRAWQITSSRKHQLISTIPTVKDRLTRCVLPKNYVQVRRHKQKLWIEHVDTISGLAVNIGEGLIYSVSWDRSFKIWRISDLRCLESINKAHSDAINAIVVCVDHGLVYTASADGSIKVWEKEKGEKNHKLRTILDNKHNKSSLNALAINSNGSILFSGGLDQNIIVWEKEEGKTEKHMGFSRFLKGHTGAILCLVCVDDLLISGSSDKTLRIWKSSSTECGYSCIAVLEGHLKPVKALVATKRSCNSNGVVSIFSGSLDGEIKVWQVTISDFQSCKSSSTFMERNVAHNA